ncbi:hypothetical protein [Mesoplasma tabanidae]|uniref:Uncharacterized protein n=1 Tax=Mesoplasma tabanidae TaxID=219745 RepID=A0A2K8P489_9MOLU|nr:hypothetical protein [Mesoplasma tabanidae]ATZ21516.1 hypothetical protein MTABA_v1c03130 [Mesoplasma tabanidae]
MKKYKKNEKLNMTFLKNENYAYWNIFDKTFYTEDKLFKEYSLIKEKEMMDFYSWLKENGNITIEAKNDSGDFLDVLPMYLIKTEN